MSAFAIPGGTVGVVGGGQLGRMMAEAAAPLGVTLDIVDPTPHAPAAPLARNHVVAPFDDQDAVERLAERVDVLTYEIELADPDALAAVESATGTPVHPSPDTLRTIQDKLVQNRAFRDAGVAVPRFEAVDTADELRAACDDLGYPVMLKARTGGYDGRGNIPVRSPDDVEGAMDAIAGPAMVEEFVSFERELSVIGVKGREQQTSFVAVENIHEQEILRESVVPARTNADRRERAQSVAEDVLTALDGRGVYGIELFETPGGDILLNEVAPRPHNSGHWTIEGAVTSQFEQHVRAVLGQPLGDTTHRGATVTANILGDVSDPQPADVQGIESVLAAGDVNLHWYGKREVRPLRKMGHLTVTSASTDDRDDLLQTARHHADAITFRDGT